jgi:hypothetical protein
MTSDDMLRAQEQVYLAQMRDVNVQAIDDLLPIWCRNIGENMPICKKAKTLEGVRADQRDVVVVAAAPSLTDEDLIKLTDFKGDIIAVNKTFERLVRLGIVPTWVVMLDAHPVSMSQFRWVRTYEWKEKPRFFVSSVTHPLTLKVLTEVFDAYMFNPLELSNEVVLSCPKCGHLSEQTTTVRLSQTWTWMNGLPEFAHGGNVGTCAFLLARELGYKRIGMMGFDFYLEPDPAWSVSHSLSMETLYYPDFGTICWPPYFKAYFAYLSGVLQDIAAEVRYLGNSPLFTHCPLVTTATIEEFLEGK